MSASCGTLRFVLLSGSPASKEIAAVLRTWYSAGLIDDAVITFADEVVVDESPPRIPAASLSEAKAEMSQPQDLLRSASRDVNLEDIRSVLVHDCDVASTSQQARDRVGYYQRYERVRAEVDKSTPRRIGQGGEEILALRVVSLFAPVSDGGQFSPEARTAIQAPAVVLSTEDRAQPHGVADRVSRGPAYAAHVAGAIATLAGLWRGLPVEELEGILLDIGGGNDQARAFRQMVRLAVADEPLSPVIDAAIATMRGDDPPNMADLGIVKRGRATDERLLQEAFDAISNQEGRPLTLRQPEQLACDAGVLANGESKRWEFAKREFKGTFVTAWVRFQLWRENRRRASLIGSNPYRDLAEKYDTPSRRVAQLRQISERYREDILIKGRDVDAPDIEPGLLRAIRREAFRLVDGGDRGSRGKDAVPVLKDRSRSGPIRGDSLGVSSPARRAGT